MNCLLYTTYETSGNVNSFKWYKQGTPMMLMGDEYGHTRYGNNNSYGHDTAINNFQWGQVRFLFGFLFPDSFYSGNGWMAESFGVAVGNKEEQSLQVFLRGHKIPTVSQSIWSWRFS